MRIGFFELEDWEEPIIKKSFPDQELYLSRENITSLNLPEKKDFDVLSVFVNSRIDRRVLDSFPNLKYLTTRSTGYDHIDRAACQQRGIAVSFVPGYGDNTVAEFTFGLLLSLTRKIYQGIDQIKETGSFALAGLRGADLAGKTIGVIGTGRIGKKVVKIAKGFEMNVVAFDPYPDRKFAQEIGLEYLPLEKLLDQADVLTFHCLYTPKTHHLINQNNIRLMKKGAYLVNTARGAIVETEALVEALDKGILAGAALDVLEEEGEIKEELLHITRGHPKEEELRAILLNHALMRMPNVLITPHNAFNSQEALVRILTITLESIASFQSGKPINLVPESK